MFLFEKTHNPLHFGKHKGVRKTLAVRLGLVDCRISSQEWEFFSKVKTHLYFWQQIKCICFSDAGPWRRRWRHGCVTRSQMACVRSRRSCDSHPRRRNCGSVCPGSSPDRARASLCHSTAGTSIVRHSHIILILRIYLLRLYQTSLRPVLSKVI